ncbi:DUF455 family protein [Paenibacillus sp. Soil750]|uniref:DUF455 family protein n=1 Tax=Paenibacillus sp. Soil750 TaxID=1736398 RepID=UPI0006F81BFD|nr:DUF455 family protein [Paenibacillus sp. Soil750]KRE70440.1 hypothetical protein ASL11_12060 [Paenibacillus sp. Soil750]
MNEHRAVNVLDQDDSEIKMKASHQQGRYLRPKDTAKLLSSLFWQEMELSRMAFGWLPGVKEIETKGQMGRLGYVHSQHAKHVFDRIAELPGSVGDRQGTPALLREAYERMSLAPSEAAFFVSYAFLLGRLYEEYEQLQLRLDPLLDAPTFDKLRYILIDRQDMMNFVHAQVQFAGTDDPDLTEACNQWSSYIRDVWHAYRQSSDGSDAEQMAWPQMSDFEPAGPLPSDSAWNEERFPIYKQNSAFKMAYSDPSMSPLNDSIKQMHYINSTEIGAAETLCYLYYGAQNMPKAFYFDLARHLWDEIRHSQMGFRRLQQMGYATHEFKYFKGSPGKGLKELANEWFPNMYSSLTMVAEPCSFIKKRKSAEQFWEFGDALSAIQCEFDMVDERMHVDFGKTWGPELYKQINHIVTAAEMSERARINRIEELGAAATPDEAKKIAKNFPGFCGLSTIELNYKRY